MRKYLPALILSLSLSSPAAMTAAQEEVERDCGMVQAMFEQGSAPVAVIEAVQATGMALSEATVYSMVCGGEENRTAIAAAGVAMAESLSQAQFVATALLATAGESGPVAVAVEHALREYEKHLPQPPVYEDAYMPTGGGVSPAQ